MHASRAVACFLVMATAAGCAAEHGLDVLTSLPWEREAFPAVPAVDDNPQTPAKVQLGRLLFYDPVLSRDRKVACATCHSELWGLSDGLALSVGVDGSGPAGPGRDGPHKTTRNSQTLWNVAFRSELFWDGRVTTLEEQALLPIENELEMGRSLGELVAELASIGAYQELFASAFGGETQPVTALNIARALAAFQRTFVSGRAPYDRYADGDAGALKPDAVEGMFAFAAAGCDTCHTPPLFQSMEYADRGLGGDDQGRFEHSGRDADRRRFRVPTLRNLRESGPYFHDGSVPTLELAVAHEAERSTLEGGAVLDDEAVANIALFIRKGLMDRSLEPDRPEDVPSGLEVPRDGSRIPR